VKAAAVKPVVDLAPTEPERDELRPPTTPCWRAASFAITSSSNGPDRATPA
jgi:hypothetical protein